MQKWDKTGRIFFGLAMAVSYHFYVQPFIFGNGGGVIGLYDQSTGKS
jgi:hypothetical protein